MAPVTSNLTKFGYSLVVVIGAVLFGHYFAGTIAALAGLGVLQVAAAWSLIAAAAIVAGTIGDTNAQ